MVSGSSEINRPNLDNFTMLQNGRLDAAIAESEARLLNTVNLDQINNPDSSFVRTQANSTYDHGMVSVHDLMALDAFGLDPDTILAKTGRGSGEENGPIADIKLPNSEFQIRRYAEGFTRYLSQPGERNADALDAEYIKTTIGERYAKSPVHQALATLKDKASEATGIKGGVSTEAFDGYADGLAMIDFLTSTGIISSPSAVRQLRQGTSAREVIDGAIAAVPDYIGKLTDDEHERIVSWSSQGLDFRLRQDKTSGMFTYDINKDPASLYYEVADQSLEATEIPFIETECGKELCRILDAKGLAFSPSLQEEMIRLGQAKRFGGVYTQITREIAKWIDKPDRLALTNLVVPGGQDIDDSELDPQELEDRTKELWLGSEVPTDSEAAQVLTTMIDQVLRRNPEIEQPSDLAVTNERVEVSDGACFDVFSYYIDAASSFNRPLRHVTDGNDVRMLEKTLGSHTFMTTDSIRFNGVQTPKGALFTHAKDGGWALLRLTPFSFDKPIDQQAFGSEIAKAYVHERENIAFLGGTTINHLVEVAR